MNEKKQSSFSGWLDKRQLFGWKSRRFCSLKGNEFTIFKANNQSRVDTVLQISQDYIIEINESRECNQFHIKFPNGKKMTFNASTKEELVRWVLALQGATYETPNVSMKNFHILSVIGRGFYGKVMLCQENITGNLVAIKSVHKETLSKTQNFHTIIRERDILIKIHHPFLASLRCAFQTDSKFYLGTEYLSGGDLFYHLSHRHTFTIDEARIIIAEISLALYHLHTLGIIYRDLKPENIVFDSQGHIKIIDYGLSKDLHEAIATKTFCGTLQFLAPEMILHQPYSFSVDWWALGILMYELIFGNVPFDNDNDNQSKLITDIVEKEPVFPPDVDQNTQNFILRLLTKNPRKRPGFTQISKDPFFNGLSFDDILAKKIEPIFKPPKDMLNQQVSKKSEEKRVIQINVDKQFLEEQALDSSIEPYSDIDGECPGFAFQAPLCRENSSDDVIISDSPPQNLSDYLDSEPSLS